MSRRFNTAGPNDPEEHHTLPVLARLPDMRRLLDDKLYFVLHAPAQAGKTTALLALAQALTREGLHAAVVLSMESGAPFRDVGMAEDAIVDAWRGAASRRLPRALGPPPWPTAPPGRRISRALQAWAEEAPRPLVVLLDDIDTLEDAPLVSALRQIREGFPDRPHHFPWSLALCGTRDVPDYKLAAGRGERERPADPFDVRSESLTLRDFTREDVAELYDKHTEETGQLFLPAAIDHAFHLTRGQPWLVNALARQLVEVLVQDRATPINADHVDVARAILVRRHEPHFDDLARRLRDPRVRRVLEPMLAGVTPGDVPEADRRLAIDLGLVRRSAGGGLEVANPIYHEVLARLLDSGARASLLPVPAPWIPDEVRMPEDREPPLEPAPDRGKGFALTLTDAPLMRLDQQEALDEWFRPVSRVPPRLDAQLPSAPPSVRSLSPHERRQRLGVARALMVAGAALALAASIARLIGGSDGAAAEAPGVSAPAVATMPAPTVESTSTPNGDPAPSRTPAPASMSASATPRPRPHAPRAPAPASATVEAARPEVQVVPGLPAPPPPNEEQMRPQLEPKVWSGEASVEEIRMLRAICSGMGDRACRDRAAEMLRKRQEP